MPKTYVYRTIMNTFLCKIILLIQGMLIGNVKVPNWIRTRKLWSTKAYLILHLNLTKTNNPLGCRNGDTCWYSHETDLRDKIEPSAVIHSNRKFTLTTEKKFHVHARETRIQAMLALDLDENPEDFANFKVIF